RVIWADALSINQGDEQEKSWQVQQMSSIHSRAQATISWLGLPSEDSKLALETLMELHTKTPIKNNVQQFVSDLIRWNAVANICARPYWSRIWIFQEMAWARNK
ncbi:heterokaryon incompatibility, partial [Polyplosphaeria fusca]